MLRLERILETSLFSIILIFTKNLHKKPSDFSKFRNIRSMTEPAILSISVYKQIIRRDINSTSSSNIIKISKIQDKSKSKYSLYICKYQVLSFQADFPFSRTCLWLSPNSLYCIIPITLCLRKVN